MPERTPESYVGFWTSQNDRFVTKSVMKSKTIILLIIVISLFAFRIWQTTGCRQFAGFYFNPISIKINVEEQTGLDGNKTLARVFHNKITSGVWELSKAYTGTFESRRLLSILGPLGLILVIASAFGMTKVRKLLTHLAIVLASQLILLLSVPPKISYYISALAWYSFAIWGVGILTKTTTRRVVFIALALATFWYFSFDWQMPAICHEIFFN